MILRRTIPLLVFSAFVLAAAVADAGRRVSVKGNVRTSKWTTKTTSFVHRTVTGPDGKKSWKRYATPIKPGGKVTFTGRESDGTELYSGLVQRTADGPIAGLAFTRKNGVTTGMSGSVHYTTPEGRPKEVATITGNRNSSFTATTSWPAKGTTFGITKRTAPDGTVTTKRFGQKTVPAEPWPSFLRE